MIYVIFIWILRPKITQERALSPQWIEKYNLKVASLLLTSLLTLLVCGNSIVGTSESCDDGNQLDGKLSLKRTTNFPRWRVLLQLLAGAGMAVWGPPQRLHQIAVRGWSHLQVRGLRWPELRGRRRLLLRVLSRGRMDLRGGSQPMQSHQRRTGPTHYLLHGSLHHSVDKLRCVQGNYLVQTLPIKKKRWCIQASKIR